MRQITNAAFLHDHKKIQQLAKHEPVLITYDDGSQQILMDYEQYLHQFNSLVNNTNTPHHTKGVGTHLCERFRAFADDDFELPQRTDMPRDLSDVFT